MNQVPFSWPQLIVIGVGLISPFLTHLVTTQAFLARYRKGLTFAISALGAVVTQVIYSAGESWKAYLAAIFYAWAAMVIGHFTGIPDAIKTKTANFGIGPKGPPRREVHAGVEVKQVPEPLPPKSPGMATKARQSKMKPPRN